MINRVWEETRIILLVGVVMPLLAYISGAGPEAITWMLAMSVVIIVLLAVDAVQRSGKQIDVATDISISDELGREMDQLVQQVEISARDMLGHVRRELSQMRSLVSDAIEVLQGSFIDLNQECWAQMTMTQDMLSNLRVVSETTSQLETMSSEIADVRDQVGNNLEEMAEISQRINKGISDAVRSLQFEDIVRQLTESSERHLDYLEAVLGAVDIGIRSLNGQRINVPDYILGLHNLKSQIDQLEADCRAEAARSVSQNSMQKGETELF